MYFTKTSTDRKKALKIKKYKNVYYSILVRNKKHLVDKQNNELIKHSTRLQNVIV